MEVIFAILNIKLLYFFIIIKYIIILQNFEFKEQKIKTNNYTINTNIKNYTKYNINYKMFLDTSFFNKLINNKKIKKIKHIYLKIINQ
jgi:hypothetical protein